ncbi:hypothetical protein AAD018_016425 [Aestuariibius insulae]
MKAMFLAFVAMGILAVGADLALDRIGFSSSDRGSGADVRLDDS